MKTKWAFSVELIDCVCASAALPPWWAHQRQRPGHQQLCQDGQEGQDIRSFYFSLIFFYMTGHYALHLLFLFCMSRICFVSPHHFSGFFPLHFFYFYVLCVFLVLHHICISSVWLFSAVSALGFIISIHLNMSNNLFYVSRSFEEHKITIINWWIKHLIQGRGGGKLSDCWGHNGL